MFMMESDIVITSWQWSDREIVAVVDYAEMERSFCMDSDRNAYAWKLGGIL